MDSQERQVNNLLRFLFVLKNPEWTANFHVYLLARCTESIVTVHATLRAVFPLSLVGCSAPLVHKKHAQGGTGKAGGGSFPINLINPFPLVSRAAHQTWLHTWAKWQTLSPSARRSHTHPQPPAQATSSTTQSLRLPSSLPLLSHCY